MAGASIRLVTLAAADRRALVARAAHLAALPADELDRALRHHTPGRGPERLSVVAPLDGLARGLAHAAARLPGWSRSRLVSRAHGLTFASGATPGRVAFLFPGQGSQHLGMLRTLRARAPLVGVWFDALNAAAAAAGQPPATRLIDPPDDAAARAEARRALHDMERGAQLGTVADLALHDVARALGLRADVHLGHSNGEHPAVIASGRVDLSRDVLCEGFIRLGLQGSRLPGPARPERLVAVSLVRPERLRDALGATTGAVSYAMDNCPSQAVVGGLAADVDALAATLTASGAVAAPLPFERAYHTPLFADWAATLASYYASLPLRSGTVPVWSCCTVGPLPDDPGGCRAAMTAQWTTSVRFRQAIESLHAGGVTVFVEVGPDSKLTAFVEDTLRGRPHVAVALNHAQRDDLVQLAEAMGQLFVAGLDVDAAALDRLAAPVAAAVPAIAGRTAPSLDTRRFAAGVHRRLIAEADAQLARAGALFTPPAGTRPVGPLVAAPTSWSATRWRTRRRFTRAGDPFVDDHALGRARAAHPDGGYPLPVLPFTVNVEIAAEAARMLTGRPVVELRHLTASRWLALDGGALDLDIEARRSPDGAVRVRLADRGSAAPGPAFEAEVATGALGLPEVVIDEPLRTPVTWNARRFYDRYAFHGPAFQGLSQVEGVSRSGIVARVTVTTLPGIPSEGLVLDPALLDVAGQLVAFWLLEQRGHAPAFGVFPFRARRVVVLRPPLPQGSTLVARAQVAEHAGTTAATIRFDTLAGAPVMAIEALEQRLVRFPASVVDRVITGEGRTPPAPDDDAFLETSWFIWERALAHLALSSGELAAWRELDPVSGERRRWLVAQLGGRRLA